MEAYERDLHLIPARGVEDSMVLKPMVSVRFLSGAKPDSLRHIPHDAERH
jgi:hypothetical protein